MDDKEWDELKLIQEKLHEALDKGYPPLGKGGPHNPRGAKKIVEEVTGIPRATCIRKLDKFVKMKILDKDEQTKRYFLRLNQSTLNPLLEGDWFKQKVSILSDFSSVVMKGLFR